MVLIEAGRFRMGSPEGEDGRSGDEGPQHGVAIVKPFALSRCEVTRGEFAAFVADTRYVTDAEQGKGCYVLSEARDSLEQSGGTDWRKPGFDQADGHPVVCVSWRDAHAYAAWLSARTGQSYRLPAEAEWEYAARAGTETSRYWGDDPDAACDYANGGDQSLKASVPAWRYSIAACDDRHAFTAPVGSYQGNGFGLSDMLGNAWEWVQDCWTYNYEQAPADGSVRGATAEGECSRVVLRGGGWNLDPVDLRSAYRSRYDAGGAFNIAGFRLARTL
jgi:formylglycine-generating enzyme required for sulfatase activity